MFVRWKKYKLDGGTWHRNGFTLTAVLVESKRIDGKPRQRFVTHLAAIRENRIKDDHYRHIFWHHARFSLDRIAEQITDDDRARIEAALSERVPLWTDEDQSKADAHYEEMKRILAGARRSDPKIT